MKTLFTMYCGLTGESDQVICCDRHAQEMPPVGELVRAEPADADCDCEFCPDDVHSEL